MTIFLDYPLPDEALFSVIARYVRDGRVSNHRRFLTNSLGIGARLTVGMACDLAHLAAQTELAWGISAREIRDRMTLHPYFAALCSDSELRSLLSVRYHAGLWSNAAVPGRLGLRHCYQCWKADVDAGKPIYWRRSHQLPGVIACGTHGTFLNFGGSGASLRLLGTAVRFDRGNAIDPPASVAQRNARVKFTRFSTRLLLRRCDVRALVERVARVEAARKCGYAAGNTVDVARMQHDLVETFGAGYFRQVGLPLHSRDWLYDAVFRSSFDSRRALTAALLQYFLQERVDRLGRSGAPVCPASVSRKDRNHRLKLRDTRDGRSHYFCSCSFSFLAAPAGSGGTTSLYPTQDGQDFAKAIAVLHGRGFATAKLARIFDLGRAEILQLLEARVEVVPWKLRTERAKHLATWVELVESCGNADLAFAKNHALWFSLGTLSRAAPDAVRPADRVALRSARMSRGERQQGR